MFDPDGSQAESFPAGPHCSGLGASELMLGASNSQAPIPTPKPETACSKELDTEAFFNLLYQFTRLLVYRIL